VNSKYEKMLIVDGQVHIWAASTPGHPWPARHAPHRPLPLGADDCLKEMAAAGVDRAILLPPSWEGKRNDLVIEAARKYPDKFERRGFGAGDGEGDLRVVEVASLLKPVKPPSPHPPVSPPPW
jgi:predicted TIM-barrel fold metal-dependent hydrolase